MSKKKKKKRLKEDNLVVTADIKKKSLVGEPVDIPADALGAKDAQQSSEDFLKQLSNVGSIYSTNQIASIVADSLATKYYRTNLYREYEHAGQHAYVAGALDLYVDSVTADSSIANKPCWVECEGDERLSNILNSFLEEVGVYERLRDWTGQVAQYGDFFINPIGKNGIGVAYIDDSIHPADIERLDINGRLEGFLRYGHEQATNELKPPWEYIHFRMHGITKRMQNTALGIFGHPGRQYQIDTASQKKMFKITTRYGTSLLQSALPIYKRLKLSEDSVLMARITRGMLWYLYKIKVDGGNPDAAHSIVAEYQRLLKRKSAMNTDMDANYWKDRFGALYAQIEDMYVPETEDMSVDVKEMGGKVHIKGIVDIDMLENRLLGSLRVSKAMLGITEDLPGSLGEGAMRRISINFAKNANRLQQAMKAGVKRLCQIHLAYLGENPDPKRFEIIMADTNSAEEEEIKDALRSGTEVVDGMMRLMNEMFEGRLDNQLLMEYFNKKVLKLNDFDLDKYIIKAPEGEDMDELGMEMGPELPEEPGIIAGEAELEEPLEPQGPRTSKTTLNKGESVDSDLMAYLPRNKRCTLTEKKTIIVKEKQVWDANKRITIKETAS